MEKKRKKFEILHFLPFQKVVFDYYNTILHYFDLTDLNLYL